jgi:ABC-type multidrug transport system fused ATPase/permease subunit
VPPGMRMGSPLGGAVNAERGGGSRSAIRAAAGPDTAAKKKPNLRKVLPEIWKIIRPRRWLLLFGLLLVAIKSAASFVLPMTSKYLLDNVFHQHQKSILLPLVLIVLAATLVQAIASYSLTQLLSKAAQRMITELREDVQKHIGRLPISFYDANRTGVLVARIMTDVEGIRNLVGTGLVEFMGGIVTALVAFFLLLSISPRMTIILFAILLIFVVILQSAFKKIRPIFRERGRINAEVTGRLTESLGGVRVVKGYHAEEREAGVFSAGVHRLLENVISSLTATSLLALSATAVIGIVGGLVMLLGGHQQLAGHITSGQYVEYTFILALMIAPIFQVVNVGTQLTEAVAGLDRTMEVLSEREEFDDPERRIELPPIDGRVEFADVRFAYEADKPVLHGISFLAEPGTVTALVGSSGSGKSTIISLICGFHTPDDGSIFIDGYDLARVDLPSYRSQLGVVLQESFLFDGTIRENILFSAPHATEEQMLHACHIARVDEFAERFAEGYDTIVGERGVKLSGGQRQRLSIARALLANPRLLILDEATSSLDSESEAMIQQGLNTLMQGRTTFVIAHRLSTIRKADQILVVEGGEILERGTHASLYALGGRYYDLYTRQHGIEENLFLAPGEGDVVPAT